MTASGSAIPPLLLAASGAVLRSSFGGSEQLPDFVAGIEVWLSACRTIRQQPQRRNLGQRIRGTPVTGEATHNAEARRPFRRLLVGMLGRPLQRQQDGDVRTAFSRHERGELLQPSLMPNQLEPKAATQSQVVANT